MGVGYHLTLRRTSRFPQGERGLKYTLYREKSKQIWSLPARGAWIEVLNEQLAMLGATGRFPQGERGLKFFKVNCCHFLTSSLPARGAWIEVLGGYDTEFVAHVASRKGSVD